MATNNALSTTSTVDSLTGQLRAHMLGRCLPAPAFVQLDMYNRCVSVYPRTGLHLATGLGNLLIWAHTLTDVTAEWWRTTADRLHVTVHGRTSGGLRLELYTGCPFTQTAGLVRLAPDQRDGVSLDELYALAELLRETHQPQGVA
jgi:hypothetical protein